MLKKIFMMSLPFMFIACGMEYEGELADYSAMQDEAGIERGQDDVEGDGDATACFDAVEKNGNRYELYHDRCNVPDKKKRNCLYGIIGKGNPNTLKLKCDRSSPPSGV